ncbi:MAG: glycosyltransferase family 1 protein [Verrucomicrobiota bacterium]
MSELPHIVLISNYRPDGQYSMLRFAEMLEVHLRKAGASVTRLEPLRVFGGKGPLAKWRGYLDKYLLFPGRLKRELKRLSQTHGEMIVHITDHSNAPYHKAAKGHTCLITCHDLMAIKSALGLVPQNRTRLSGRILQRWILKHLKNATHVCCLSEKTRSDLITLTKVTEADVEVIPAGLPYPFEPTPSQEAKGLINPLTAPYVLHVGSDAWYKNRLGVLEIFLKLRKQRPELKLAFVGPESTDLKQVITEQILGASVVFVSDITDEKLQALYSLADCLIFPSHDEGFGWPIAEAQACGTPAMITDRPPMTEVGGEAAVRLPTTPSMQDKRESWAERCAVIIVESLKNRDSLSAAGIKNVMQFEPAQMAERYLKMYQKILTEQST